MNRNGTALVYWSLRLALIGYACGMQAGLAVLHFVVAVPYLSLLVLPIPVLAPVAFTGDALRGTRRLYLCLQIGGVTVQMALRLALDLWLPVRI